MDQSQKVLKHAHSTCTVSSFHFDKMLPSHLYKLQNSLARLPCHVSMFIFTSPQCFCNQHCFRNYLFAKKPIKFIIVDEIHLFAQFDNSFRTEFGLLKRSLFDKLTTNPTKIQNTYNIHDCNLYVSHDRRHSTHYWMLIAMVPLAITINVLWELMQDIPITTLVC